jgi:hypothetical protein
MKRIAILAAGHPGAGTGDSDSRTGNCVTCGFCLSGQPRSAMNCGTGAGTLAPLGQPDAPVEGGFGLRYRASRELWATLRTATNLPAPPEAPG